MTATLMDLLDDDPGVFAHQRLHADWDGLDGWGDNHCTSAICDSCKQRLDRGHHAIRWFVDAHGYAVIGCPGDCITVLLARHAKAAA